MKVNFSDHLTYKKLFKVTLPSMLMMLFTSIYSIIDGLFVSNVAGKDAFAAVNLMMPIILIVGSLGFMMGSGGAALVAKTLGEKEEKKACEYFSLIVYFTMILGIVVSLAIYFFIEPIAKALGSTEEMLPYAVKYTRIMIIFEVMYMLQNAFQNLFVAANKPLFGFYISIIAGLVNIIGDYLLVKVFNFGVEGAAIATGLSQSIAAIIPIIYFARPNTSALRLCKTQINLKVIVKACTNGSSELLTNISQSLVSIVYNKQLLSYIGSNGVSAYGVIMYVGFMFNALYMGYALGQSGFVSYNYGACNNSELKNIRKKSININIILGVLMITLVEIFARPLSLIFVGYDKELLDITVFGFRIYGISFIFSGINIYTSSFFTSLSNGLISGISSTLRTLVFQIICVLTLPLIFGFNGIWSSIIVAEVLALIMNIIFLVKYQKRYNY